MSVRTIVWAPACRECGAPFGAPCDVDCASAVAIEHEQAAADLDVAVCCSSPAYAAATWCGCQGVAS